MRGEMGRVLKKGRIRVDARKAITKLRDHLLVDLHLYAIELVRAAVLAGASRVDVTFDADDVIVAFDGRPLDPSELPRLFEHLTGDADGEDGRSSRLLALAVNAALGLAPAWISLTTSNAGAAARVTWTPALVTAIERDLAPLPEPEVVPRPADMPATGTRFQLHRKVGWEVVRRAAARDLPREIALLTEAAICPRVPLFVNGEPAAPPSRPPALARAALSLPGAREAHVEILSTLDTAPHADFCELGLVLARTSLAFGRHFPMAEHLGVSPPVRVVIDADALPTNASRSAVREDASLWGALAGAAAAALSDAIAGIAAALFGAGTVPGEGAVFSQGAGVTVDTSNQAALEDALGAFLCVAEGSLIARVALPDALRALLDLPLFRDGLGRGLAHRELPQADPLLVWTGKEAVPEEMALWARGIVWRTGRVAERILGARRWVDPEHLEAGAKQGAARYRKLLAMPAGEPAVPDEPYLARERFSFAEGPLAGLAGEVAIAAGGAAHVRNMALRVFLKGRCFHTFPIPEDAVPLRCVIAVAWEGHIVPKFGYVGVEANAGMRAALAYAVRAAVLLCEKLAADRARRNAPLDLAEAAVLRSALATAALAPTRMYSVQGFEMPALADLQALIHAPIWPAAADRLVSLQALCEYAAKTGAVCVAAPGTPGVAPDRRPVVRAAAQEVEHLRLCLHPSVALVPYTAALVAAGEPRRAHEHMAAFIDQAAAAERAPVYRFEAPGALCLVTLGQSRVRVWHGNGELSHVLLDPSMGGMTVAIDDDSIVPTEKWDGVLFAADPQLAARVERAYAERVVDALLGDEAARAELFQGASRRTSARYVWPADPRELPAAVRRYLIHRAARGRAPDATSEDRDLGARIEMIPIFTMIGADGLPAPASLSAIESAHPIPEYIPRLRATPHFRTVNWRPVIADEEDVIAALGRWSEGRLHDASGELWAQEEAAGRESEYTEFLARPAVDVSVAGPRGDAEHATVHLPASPEHGLHGVAAALPAPGVDITHAVVEVTYEERAVGEQVLSGVPIPIVARVSVMDRESLEGWSRLSPFGVGGVGQRVRHAAVELALAVLERASRPGAAHMFFGDARALSLVVAVLAQEEKDERIERALRGGSLHWPTVHGGSRPWPHLRIADGELLAGTVAYASWIAASPPTELDRPILHIPPSQEGSLTVKLLHQLGVRLRNVSDPIAALQAKRAMGAKERPRLAERPVDPRLARDLQQLGVKELEGEIGIFESGEAVAEITTLDGEAKRVPLDLPFSARVVARADVLTLSAQAIAVSHVTRAAIDHLVGLIHSVHELPPFVRSHLRAIVCRAFSKGRDLPAAARRAPVFRDIDGRWWSLEQLQSKEHGDWSCTFDPPPYPKARQEGHTLSLTQAEHLQLHAKVPILNVTEWMRRDLEAERRREAPPVPEVRFDAAARAHLLGSFAVDDGSLTGEIGLLRPQSHAARGIQVFVTRRPVCRIDDAPGWPLAAVLNDDGLHPNRWFIEILPAEETALRSRVRRLAGEHVQRTLLAALPRDRLAEVFLDQMVPPVAAYGSTAPMSVTGYLYLPGRWPATPTVRVFVQGLPEPVDHAVEQANAPIQPALPIGGTFYVAHAEATFGRGAACRVALALRAALERLLAPLVSRTPDDPELAAYLWNVRLLGGTTAGIPTATAVDGRTIRAEDVLSALERGEVWITDQRGDVDGAFPAGTPPFVLRDEPSALLRVLRARAPREKLKRLGGVEVERAGEAIAPPSIRPPQVPDVIEPASPESNRRPARSWLGALIDLVSGLFTGGSAQEPPSTGIGAAVESALRALRLRDEPVVVVKEATRGKLLRYDEDVRVITINVAHAALAPIVAARSPAALRRACIALTAAALSEVNIALEHVTDHDEAQALLELLRQDAAAAAQPQSPDPSA